MNTFWHRISYRDHAYVELFQQWSNTPVLFLFHISACQVNLKWLNSRSAGCCQSPQRKAPSPTLAHCVAAKTQSTQSFLICGLFGKSQQLSCTQSLWVAGLLIFSKTCMCVYLCVCVCACVCVCVCVCVVGVCIWWRWLRFIEKTRKEFPYRILRPSVCFRGKVCHWNTLLFHSAHTHTRTHTYTHTCQHRYPQHPQMPKYLFHESPPDNTFPLAHCLFAWAQAAVSLGKKFEK